MGTQEMVNLFDHSDSILHKDLVGYAVYVDKVNAVLTLEGGH